MKRLQARLKVPDCSDMHDFIVPPGYHCAFNGCHYITTNDDEPFWESPMTLEIVSKEGAANPSLVEQGCTCPTHVVVEGFRAAITRACEGEYTFVEWVQRDGIDTSRDHEPSMT